mmetsp:Transcript_8834/g.18837  ORF Transcript_8834/g.18837 Transcript_8834/m.18837 type:complete len:266 (-) Transcript_8834:51-848(-)
MAKPGKTGKALYGSSGVFPGQTAIKSVSEADLCRLTYRTTTGTGVPGRVMSHEDKWENFMEVHDMGKKDTQYMKYQKNVAPLLDHSACTCRRDFVPMPVGDNIINNQLAETNKNGLNAGKKPLAIEQKATSSYASEFVATSPHRMRGAKPESTKPKANRTATITGMKDMMETRPQSHVHFRPPNSELAKAGEICLAPGNLGLSARWNTGPPTSSYGKTFNSRSMTSSAPQLIPMDSLMGNRPPELLPDDDPVFQVRRSCFLSPGQ